MQTLPYIEYNSSNNDWARQNRKKMTKAESEIWHNFLKHRPM
jgi:very-short-patch-repair endonuclease